MVAPAKGSLQLHLHAAATPDRVAIAANMFSQMLRVAYPALPEDSVTMVVSNFDMTAGIRYQSSAGHAAVDSAVRFFERPIREAKKRSAWRSAANIISEHLQQLLPYGPEIRTPRKVIRTVDADFLDLIKRVARRRRQHAVRGPTLVYSHVYRVGKTDDGKILKARVRIDGAAHDIPIKTGAEASFFDAAKHGGVYVVHVDAAWVRNEEDDLDLEPNRSFVTHVEPWKPASGADFMQHVRRSPTQLFENIDEVIDDLEGF